MLVLRDGEWSWWCSCGFQSPASPSLALVTAGHRCGGPGIARPSGELEPGPPSKGVVYRRVRREDSDVGAGFICQISKLR
jgi:hypothetical protein